MTETGKKLISQIRKCRATVLLEGEEIPRASYERIRFEIEKFLSEFEDMAGIPLKLSMDDSQEEISEEMPMMSFREKLETL